MLFINSYFLIVCSEHLSAFQITAYVSIFILILFQCRQYKSHNYAMTFYLPASSFLTRVSKWRRFPALSVRRRCSDKRTGMTQLMVIILSPCDRSVPSAEGNNICTSSDSWSKSFLFKMRLSWLGERNSSANFAWSRSTTAGSCLSVLFHWVAFVSGSARPEPNADSKDPRNNAFWWIKLANFETLAMHGWSCRVHGTNAITYD